MKRMIVMMAVVIVAVVTMGFLSAGTAAEQGTIKETADFKIMVPNGWEFSDFGNGALQTYNKSGTYMVEVKKAGSNMNDKDVENGVATLAQKYKGTNPTKLEMLGLVFYKTTFDAASTHQTLYSALKDGSKISIGLMGKDHETDPTIQAVFQSIQLK